jgi:hypothetical protein
MKKLLLLSNIPFITLVWMGCHSAKNNSSVKSNGADNSAIKSEILHSDTIITNSQTSKPAQKDSPAIQKDTLRGKRIEHGSQNQSKLDSIKSKKNKAKRG